MLIFAKSVTVDIREDIIVLFNPKHDDAREVIVSTDHDGWRRYTFKVKREVADDTG